MNNIIQSYIGVSLGKKKISIKNNTKSIIHLNFLKKQSQKLGRKMFFILKKILLPWIWCTDAYKNFLKKNSKFKKEDIDNLIFVTETNNFNFPEILFYLHH